LKGRKDNTTKCPVDQRTTNSEMIMAKRRDEKRGRYEVSAGILEVVGALWAGGTAGL
jgi:hypothetical protein